MRSDAPEFRARDGSYEGVFFVQPSQKRFTSGADAGQTVWIADQFRFYSQNPDGSDRVSN